MWTDLSALLTKEARVYRVSWIMYKEKDKKLICVKSCKWLEQFAKFCIWSRYNQYILVKIKYWMEKKWYQIKTRLI